MTGVQPRLSAVLAIDRYRQAAWTIALAVRRLEDVAADLAHIGLAPPPEAVADLWEAVDRMADSLPMPVPVRADPQIGPRGCTGPTASGRPCRANAPPGRVDCGRHNGRARSSP